MLLLSATITITAVGENCGEKCGKNADDLLVRTVHNNNSITTSYTIGYQFQNNAWPILYLVC